MPPPCCRVSAASRRAEKMPSIESSMVPMTKQLKRVTARPVPAPARMRPAGRNLCPARAAAKSCARRLRCSGFSAAASASATRAQLVATSWSMGVPSAALKRYFMSQIWLEILVIKIPVQAARSIPDVLLTFQKGLGRGLDPLLQDGHELRPFQPRRDRLQERQGDGAGPLPETLPVAAGIERHRHAGNPKLAIQPGHPRLVVRRRARLPAGAFGEDHHRAALRQH